VADSMDHSVLPSSSGRSLRPNASSNAFADPFVVDQYLHFMSTIPKEDSVTSRRRILLHLNSLRASCALREGECHDLAMGI